MSDSVEYGITAAPARAHAAMGVTLVGIVLHQNQNFLTAHWGQPLTGSIILLHREKSPVAEIHDKQTTN